MIVVYIYIKEVKEYFDHVFMNGTNYLFSSHKLITETAEVDFILGDESRGYIEELYKLGLELSKLNEKLYTVDGQPNFKLLEENENEYKMCQKNHNLLINLFHSESVKLKDHFHKYMRLE